MNGHNLLEMVFKGFIPTPRTFYTHMNGYSTNGEIKYNLNWGIEKIHESKVASMEN